MTEIIPLRDGISEQEESYVADAAKLLFVVIRPASGRFFQARKVGLSVHVPEKVRQKMLAMYGVEASEMLATIDGRVYL